MAWKHLVGKTILSFEKTSNGIVFNTPDGNVEFSAWGDCCSYSWVDSIEELSAFPGVVLVATAEDGPQGESAPDPKVKQEEPEYLRVYFFKLKTDKGYFDLTMYNDSNGYYGGELREVGGKDDWED